MGQKALFIQVDMKRGLINCMPPFNELTIVTFFRRYSHFDCKIMSREFKRYIHYCTLVQTKNNDRAKPYMGRIENSVHHHRPSTQRQFIPNILDKLSDFQTLPAHGEVGTSNA